MITMPTLLDRARLELFVQRLDYHLSGLGGQRRQVRRESRSNAQAAASDLGTRQAVANLGDPRTLASGYAAAEGRPLPRYRRGIWWAAATLAVYNWAVLLYATGFAHGGAAASPGGTQVTTSFLGAAITANGAQPGLGVEFNLFAVVLPVTVIFLLASRAWRALPPVRRRLAARASNTPG